MTAPTRCAVLLLFLLSGVAAPLAGQAVSEDGSGDSVDQRAGDSRWVDPTGAPRKRADAVRVPEGAIQLDGRLTDAAWAQAPAITDFVQKQPVEGGRPTDSMVVRFVYDGDALYVGARMYAANLSSIQAPIGRRDNIGQMEHFIVSLDTYLDRRTAYTFAVTASGVRGDFYHPVDDEYTLESSFDPVWQAKAHRDSLGWTAEMRIPFSQLRFRDQPEQLWGLNIDRWIPSRNEDVFWIPVPTNVRGWASRFGNLVGISGVRPSRRIELLPYVASETVQEEPAPGDPFAEEWEARARVGADLKMGLGPNLTLEATVNPDFGQVEADPAEVNLSQYETFFSERRPFFIEGSRLFEANGPAYFYSRRIGARPPHDVLDALAYEHEEFPATSTILGAAKLTGRLQSGTSIGALAAATQREHARIVDAAGTIRSVRVAPFTGYAVTRVEQELGASGSTGGVILTGLRRDLDDPALLALLPRDAVTGGADVNLRLGGGEYVLAGFGGFSRVTGSEEAILRLQRAPARYFQRPDADHVEVDPTRTSLAGYAWGAELSRISGDHWLWSVTGGAESPGLELNDIGRLVNADERQLFANLRYRETQPNRWLRNYSVEVSSENGWNFDGVQTWGALRTDWSLTFPNFWSANLTGWVDLPAQSQSLTRGGPLMGTHRAWVVIGRLSNSFAATRRWNGRIYYGENEAGEVTYRLSGGVSVRPSPQWQLSVNPNYLRTINPRQYITTCGPDRSCPATNDATFGNRYIFSFVDRSTFLMQLRANYAFRPDLTFELYAEPFAASGRFYDFGELPAPRSRALRHYGREPGSTITLVRDAEGDPDYYEVTDGGETFTLPFRDFNVLSFRSNAVLRWEWRPGSTLFVVWQQDREDATAVGDLVSANELFSSFAAPGRNLFAVKMNFWIPVD